MGAVQQAVLRAVIAVIDFIYYSQLQIHTSKTLDALLNALKTFHENKDVFVQAGIREHFNIPKLHAMIHYLEAIKSRGSADGFNTESPERLHIDFAKEGYRASNKRDYIKQMVVWLGRQEAVARFSAYLDYLTLQQQDRASTSATKHCREDQDDDGDDEEIDEEAEQVQAVTTLPASSPISPKKSTHFVSVKPAAPHRNITTIIFEHKVENLIPALSTFIRRAYPPPLTPKLPDTTDVFDVYKRLSIQLPSIDATGRTGYIDRIRATPAIPAQGLTKEVPSHFDVVLVQTEDRNNPSTKGTYLEGAC